MENNKINLLREVLTVRNYASRTIDTYIKSINTFFSFSNQTSPTQKLLFDYALFLKNKNLSFSHIKNSVMAVKLFSELVLGIKLNSNFLSHYRKERKLPDVLSIEEIKQVIGSIENLKHRTIISLIYSCGLRISECVNIKVSDIDSKRMMTKVVQSKGNKDRYVPLSNKMLLLLREYYKDYKPKEFLFEGQIEQYYSVRSIQSILKSAISKTKIKKKISVLLGHKDIKTTLLYTQISQSQLSKINNPFDTF
jgi:site-specific recombinase XerD